MYCIYIKAAIKFTGTKEECEGKLHLYPGGYIDHIF